MALPVTNAGTPIDSHRLDGSLWKPRSIFSYSEGYFNPPLDLTLTEKRKRQNERQVKAAPRFDAYKPPVSGHAGLEGLELLDIQMLRLPVS